MIMPRTIIASEIAIIFRVEYSAPFSRNGQQTLTQEHHDVRLDNQLALRRPVYVADASVRTLVHERRTANVVPHLTGNENEAKHHSQQTPQLFVVQKFEIVSSQVEETGEQRHKHHDCHCAGIVWWTENSNLNVGTLLDPFGN